MEKRETNNFHLTNGGNLEIFFIGVGGALSQKHNNTNFLIVKGDKHIMVDFGVTACHGFSKMTGLPLHSVENLLITHSHLDHAAVEPLVITNRYVGRKFFNSKKLTLLCPRPLRQVLWNDTWRGGLSYNEYDCERNIPLTFSDYFDVIEPTWKQNAIRESYLLDIGDIHLEMFRTKHTPEQSHTWEDSSMSIGMLIDDRVFISGDTRFDRELIDIYAPVSEIMFHDVQFFPGAVP